MSEDESIYYIGPKRVKPQRDPHQFDWVPGFLVGIAVIVIMFDFISAAFRGETVSYSEPETTAFPVQSVSTDGRSWTIIYLNGDTVGTLVLSDRDVTVEDTDGDQVFEYTTFTKTTVTPDRAPVLVQFMSWVISVFTNTPDEDRTRTNVETGVTNTGQARHTLRVHVDEVGNR